MPRIQNEVKKYKESKVVGHKNIVFDELIYEPVKGEKINVVSWVRYPSYDFIFGCPAKDNPMSKNEVAFFQFRDTRTKEVKQGFYLDKTELDEMIDGFSKIKNY
ncbi:MAG: hypothetical protein P1P85_04290 [Patescibacteria group bacterium]|nr:hypothetical protein [Patescibacteria group bacterium]